MKSNPRAVGLGEDQDGGVANKGREWGEGCAHARMSWPEPGAWIRAKRERKKLRTVPKECPALGGESVERGGDSQRAGTEEWGALRGPGSSGEGRGWPRVPQSCAHGYLAEEHLHGRKVSEPPPLQGCTLLWGVRSPG